MSIKELRTKSSEELVKQINDLKAELFMLRFKNSTGQLTEFHKIESVKKEIARVFTVINANQAAAAPKKVAAPKTEAVAPKKVAPKKVTIKKAPAKKATVKKGAK